MTDSINGWTPPIVYDLGTDTRRIATQADVDDMQRQLLLLGGFYTDTKRAIEGLARNLSNSRNAKVASAAMPASVNQAGVNQYARPVDNGWLFWGVGQ
jgi:hypothetical protein